MQLEKDQEKQLLIAIKNEAKKRNIKSNMGRLFFVKDNAFVHCNYIVIKRSIMDYSIYIKEYEYDDIFWDIMHMQKNSKQPISLRACGAFSSPSIKIFHKQIEEIDNYEETARLIVNDLEKYSLDFLCEFDIGDYIINEYDQKSYMYGVLECLALVHKGKTLDAKKIAKEFIEHGDRGSFVNENKGFYEWLLDY